jgi:VWFA-related protein
MRKFSVVFFILVISSVLIKANPDISSLKIYNVDYKTDFPKVSINFRVLNNKNQPISTFTENNFLITVNNEPVNFKLEKNIQDKSVSMLLLVDASGSINGKTLYKIEKKIQTILSQMRKNDEVTLFSFNDYPMRLQNLTSDKQTLINAIKKIGRAGTLTRLYNAVYRGIRYLNNNAKNEKKVCVILSDGKEEGSTIGMHKVISFAKKSDVPVYSLGYSNINTKYFSNLKKLSRETDGKFSIQDKNKLSSKILYIEKSTYKATFTLNKPMKKNTVSVKLKATEISGSIEFSLNQTMLLSKNSTSKKTNQTKYISENNTYKYVIFIGSFLILLMLGILILMILITRRRRRKEAEARRIMRNEMRMVENMKNEKDDFVVIHDKICPKNLVLQSSKNMDVKSVGVEICKSIEIMEINVELNFSNDNGKNANVNINENHKSGNNEKRQIIYSD